MSRRRGRRCRGPWHLQRFTIWGLVSLELTVGSVFSLLEGRNDADED